MQMENYTRDMPQTPPIGLDLTFPPQELQSGTPWLDSIIFFFSLSLFIAYLGTK